MSAERVCFHPIGIIHSPNAEPKGTPIQPRYAENIAGSVEVFPEYVDALVDLAGFERIWLIFHLDRNDGWQAKVTPFRDVVQRGLFATRAPKRPNPIGMSCVRLKGVEGNILHVADLDILDKTPLLDIKPYVAEFDAYPNATAGWLENAPKSGFKADNRFRK